MPDFPDFPRKEDDRAPNPQDIVDRIIHGRLHRSRPRLRDGPLGH